MAKLVIGIMGGMGAGKTSLAARWAAKFGAELISVDQERREVAGSGAEGFQGRWESCREQVRSRVAAKIAACQGVALLEWARLVEDGFGPMVDAAVALDCPQAVRLARLEGGDLPRDSILARMALQMPAIESVAAIKALGKRSLALDSCSPISDEAMSRAFDELAGAEFSSSASFCLFRIPRQGGRVIWEVTNSCNYGCRYCIFSSTPRKPEGELSPQRMLEVVDELAAQGFTHIKFTGGEPFLRPDLMAILGRARDLGFKSDLSTNAAFIDAAAAAALAGAGLEMVHVSLDGHERRIQEAARGARTFEPTVAGIKALAAQGIRVRIGCVVFKGNQDHLADIARFCQGLGCSEAIFSLMEPAGRMRGDSKLLCELGRGELLARVAAARAAVAGLMEVSGNFPAPAPSGCGSCPGGERFLFIDHKGSVSPCPWVSDRSSEFNSGSTLHASSLAELMGGAPNRRFRRIVSELSGAGLASCPIKAAPELDFASRVQALFDIAPGASIDLPAKFSQLSPAYLHSNENVAGWIEAFDLAGKDVLAVGGSGDQMICSYAAGAASVENFDLNLLSRPVAELKWAMLGELGREEFIEFFEGFDPAAYARVRASLPTRARLLFDRAYRHVGGDGSALAASGLFRPRQGRALLLSNLPHLASDAAYDRTKAACQGKPFVWRAGGARAEAAASGGAYDAVILSNLSDYAHVEHPGDYLAEFVREVAGPLAAKLRPGGAMMAGYVFDASDLRGSSLRSLVNDPAARARAFGSLQGMAYEEARFAGAWGGGEDLAMLWRAPQ